MPNLAISLLVESLLKLRLLNFISLRVRTSKVSDSNVSIWGSWYRGVWIILYAACDARARALIFVGVREWQIWSLPMPVKLVKSMHSNLPTAVYSER